MSTESTQGFEPSQTNENTSHTAVRTNQPVRSWPLRRLCSQNPFYLLSVCFVLHAIAHWYHAESGVPFSPWPLLWVTTGYTLLLAMTGFVVIRFGRVWDDARSILLIILLLFVQLSLIFDETLLNDPQTGRKLLLVCWVFSAVLSELLLVGLKIVLPWRYRLPYHGLIALLFFYPLSLVSMGTRLPTETVVWRIFLFPAIAAIVVLTLIPAIRRSSADTRSNGTPWLWPWYPWSLFVFLGVCVCFRSYALCQSFDPVLGESNQAAMAFTSVFGVYFLVPLIFASGVLLMEIGLIERRRGVVGAAMIVPILCVRMSVPVSGASGPYIDFLDRLTSQAGSPIWLTLMIANVYYAFAVFRSVRAAELWLTFTLFLLTRVGPKTVDISTLTALEWWPVAVISAIHLILGISRRDSRLMLISLLAAIATLQIAADHNQSITLFVRQVVSPAAVGAILLVGAIFKDDFAWLLRLIGAPLLVAATVVGIVVMGRSPTPIPLWLAPTFVVAMTLTAWLYAIAMRMSLYRLSSVLCGTSGTAGLCEMAAVYFVRESGWPGATSFVAGLSFFMVAAIISSWKAGWLTHLSNWLREMLVVPMPELRPIE